jgi:hypothetical protein
MLALASYEELDRGSSHIDGQHLPDRVLCYNVISLQQSILDGER